MEAFLDPRAHRVLAGVSRVRVLEYLRARPAGARTGGRRAGRAAPEHRAAAPGPAGGCRPGRAPGRAPVHPGRPRLLFAAVPGAGTSHAAIADGGAADAGAVDGYQALAGVLAGQLGQRGPDAAADAVAAGRVWARSLPDRRQAASAGHGRRRPSTWSGSWTGSASRRRPPAPDAPIELHRCPFPAGRRAAPGVVCGVHLGLHRRRPRRTSAPRCAPPGSSPSSHRVLPCHLAPGRRPGPRHPSACGDRHRSRSAHPDRRMPS